MQLLQCSQWVDTSGKMKQCSEESNLSYKRSSSFTTKAWATGIRRNLDHSYGIYSLKSWSSRQSPHWKIKGTSSVNALPNMQSEWPSQTFTPEAQVHHACPKPVLSHSHEFSVAQIKFRTYTYLSRTKTYLCSHCTVLAVTCPVQKKQQPCSLLSTSLKHQGKWVLKKNSEADAGFLIDTSQRNLWDQCNSI